MEWMDDCGRKREREREENTMKDECDLWIRDEFVYCERAYLWKEEMINIEWHKEEIIGVHGR